MSAENAAWTRGTGRYGTTRTTQTMPLFQVPTLVSQCSNVLACRIDTIRVRVRALPSIVAVLAARHSPAPLCHDALVLRLATVQGWEFLPAFVALMILRSHACRPSATALERIAKHHPVRAGRAARDVVPVSLALPARVLPLRVDGTGSPG